MGKAGRWLRSILAGKKRDGGVRGRERKALPQPQGDATASPPSATGTPREKKRWSFRRPSSVAQGKPVAAAAASPSPLSQEKKPSQSVSGREIDVQSERAMEVAVAAADAAVMAATQAAAAVGRLAETEEESDVLARWLVEEAAAARIQATFRGYLARKALCALRGLVKLQALIRGQLVRRQATATLRRMQALVSAQSRLRAQHARLLDHQDHPAAAQCRSPQHPRRRSSYEMNRSSEEHIKVVEMDVGEPARRGRNSCSVVAGESRDRRLAAEYYYQYQYGQCSPAPSSAELPDLSPRTYSGHLDDLLAFDSAAATARSGSPYDATDMGYVPSYMANTESSRAKARSQSAPRQRTDALERQPSRRRGGGAPSKKTMQRSSSHIGVPATACRYQFQYPPWAGVRLDRSSASLVGSECGSTSSVLTAATAAYCRSLVGFEVQREATTEHRLQEARHVSNCIRQH